jgi:hypothetical protein
LPILWETWPNHTKKEKMDDDTAHKGTITHCLQTDKPKPTRHHCVYAVLRYYLVDAASHQTTHATTSCLQAGKDLHVDNSFNFYTTSITLCLDHTSNHSKIPPKRSHIIIAKLITHRTEQLGLLVRSSATRGMLMLQHTPSITIIGTLIQVTSIISQEI